MTGTTVGHYELLEKIGEGGMGVVYRARDLVLNRFVAMKFLPPDASPGDDRKRRFLQEAPAASALNHSHIVTIYEIGPYFPGLLIIGTNRTGSVASVSVPVTVRRRIRSS